ncbi:MAG: hypothetical protein LBR39_08470 [Coriobacteriales bacterium]|jgi:hypothetical protein|nr:hypothetical protein [Coriobacteriales bacterium]
MTNPFDRRKVNQPCQVDRRRRRSADQLPRIPSTVTCIPMSTCPPNCCGRYL